ncbi:hypothetical protein COL940_010630 [Colletotrichum noveboracense]|nr:hypothetical protein COL940_010630 [Colletotrichum noveboracense]
MKRNCKAAFKFHQLIKPLDYDGDVEKAGGYFVDVLSILDGVGTVTEAARGLAAVEATTAKFTATADKVAELEAGYYLKAEGRGGTVRVFRDAGDGKPIPLATDADRKGLKASLERSSFENCRKCIGAPARRDQLAKLRISRQVEVLDLCCLTLDEFEERPESEWSDSDVSDVEEDDIIPIQPVTRSVGKLTEAADLSTSQKALLQSMQGTFSSFFSEGKNAALDTDAVTKAFHDAKYTQKVTGKITQKAMELYGVTQEEVEAISNWASYFVDDALDSALAQIPPTTGLCLRTTDLNAETLEMLTKGGTGLRSQKSGGVYEVQDLLKIKRFMGDIVEPEETQIMASFLGVQQEFDSSAGYRFVINSKTGRYIEPLLGDYSTLSEVDFVQGYSEFKLLGWEELNGGEVSRAAGKPGPYGVF